MENKLKMPTISGGDLQLLCAYSLPIAERNEVFLKCSKMILERGELNRLENLFNEMNGSSDIHPMLLESILVVTAGVEELKPARLRTEETLNTNIERLELVKRQTELIEKQKLVS
jgi:hypothetical protein